MKILFINRDYPPNGQSGPAFMVQGLADQLTVEGEPAVVVCRHLGPRLQVDLVNGVRVYRLPLALDDQGVSDEISRILESEQPDIAHCNFLAQFQKLEVARSVRYRNIPLIHTLHDYHLLCQRGTMFNEGRLCLEPCKPCQALLPPSREYSSHLDAVVSVSEFLLQQHLKHGLFQNTPVKKTIYNSYKIPGQETKPSLPAADNRLRLGFMGRIIRFKGIGLLLSIMQKELAHLPISLTVAGKLTPEVMPLKDRFADKNISFTGFIAPVDFYPHIDILVVPSLFHDPGPRVALESLTHGVPVIGSQRGGLPEVVVPGKNGWLFDPDHPEELVELLTAICGNRQLISDLHIDPQDIANRYAPEHILAQYREVYQAVVSENGTGQKG